MCRRKHRAPGDLVSMHCAQPATGVASARWDKDIPTGQTLPNPDDSRPIVRRPTDLPVAAGCDRAWARTQSLWWHSALDHCATREAPTVFIWFTFLLFCTLVSLLAHHHLLIYHSSDNLLKNVIIRSYGVFIAYLLMPFAHNVYRLSFLYCVIDLFILLLACLLFTPMCNSVVVCVTLLCFILARSGLQMRTCSQLAYLVK
jgi:hypothetical protein